MFTPRYQSDETDLLVQAMLSLKTSEEAYRFLEDALTVQEMRSISQRMQVASILDRGGATYQEIAAGTGASTTTIGRVNSALRYGADGYRLVLDRMKEKTED